MPAHKIKPRMLPNTAPPVWLSADTRLAIRAFALAHDHYQIESAEELAGQAACEFHEVHDTDRWFRDQPAHTFTALHIEGEEHDKPIDLLVLVVAPEPTGSLAMLCIYTPAEKPLGDDYHVARVLHESNSIQV